MDATFEQRLLALERENRAWRRGVGVLGVVVLVLLSPRIVVTQTTAATLEERVTLLESKVNSLVSRLKHFSRSGNNVYITGANLHIRNGLNATNGNRLDPTTNAWEETKTNGAGNLIVGYNELRTNEVNDRTGSHNLVIGPYHNYNRFGGLVAGRSNALLSANSTIGGGQHNQAIGFHSAICGGEANQAHGTLSTISGGNQNKTGTDGTHSWIGGGQWNEVWGNSASISGGIENDAFGDWSSISGGEKNTTRGVVAAISGGYGSNASGGASSVSGGATTPLTGAIPRSAAAIASASRPRMSGPAERLRVEPTSDVFARRRLA